MNEGDPVRVRATLKSLQGDKAKVWIETPWGARILAIVKAGDVAPEEPSDSA